MAYCPPIFRPSAADKDNAQIIRELTERSREVLRQPIADTFLGRKTHEPFPMQEVEVVSPSEASRPT